MLLDRCCCCQGISRCIPFREEVAEAIRERCAAAPGRAELQSGACSLPAGAAGPRSAARCPPRGVRRALRHRRPRSRCRCRAELPAPAGPAAESAPRIYLAESAGTNPAGSAAALQTMSSEAAAAAAVP